MFALSAGGQRQALGSGPVLCVSTNDLQAWGPRLRLSSIPHIPLPTEPLTWSQLPFPTTGQTSRQGSSMCLR